MKRSLIFIAIVLALIVGLVGSQAPVKADNTPTTVTARVIAARLRVRDSASVHGKLVGVLRHNTVVTILGRNSTSDWLKISTSGVTGWVSAVWIKIKMATIKTLPVIS